MGASFSIIIESVPDITNVRFFYTGVSENIYNTNAQVRVFYTALSVQNVLKCQSLVIRAFIFLFS